MVRINLRELTSPLLNVNPSLDNKDHTPRIEIYKSVCIVACDWASYIFHKLVEHLGVVFALDNLSHDIFHRSKYRSMMIDCVDPTLITIFFNGLILFTPINTGLNLICKETESHPGLGLQLMDHIELLYPPQSQTCRER